MTGAAHLDEARRLMQAGDLHAALTNVNAQLQMAPGDAAGEKLRVSLLIGLATTDAVPLAQQVARYLPDDPEAQDLFGQALSSVGREVDAVAAFARAAALAPDAPAFLCNLSVAQTRLGDHFAAEQTARAALSSLPGYAPGLNALGHALQGQHRPKDAIVAFSQTLEKNQHDADALIGLSRAFTQLGQLSTAILALHRAHRIAPRQTDVLTDLAVAYRQAGVGELASQAHEELSALIRPADPLHSNVLLDMQYASEWTPEIIAEAERRFGCHAIAGKSGPELRAAPALQSRRPLRVGYMSADLGQHAVGWLSAAALIAHDPDRVHAFYYDNGGREDPLTQAIRSAPATKGWADIRSEDDAMVARRLASDEIDILVDLSGHTRGNRLGVFAMRAAPVQMGWVGYPGSSGLPTMDFAIFDTAHAPDGADALFTEQLIRLPRLRFAYSPPRDAPDVRPSPSLAKGYVTFGSFNNVSKLNEDLIATWARIMQAIPQSRIHLKWKSFDDPIVCLRIQTWFAQNGIAPERVTFSGHVSHQALLATYGDIDVALDTYPFAGGVTTAEALFMSVPVVSRYGSRIASRQGLAFLSSLGRDDWAQETEAGYVNKAIELAQDASVRGEVRKTQRARMLSSSICDGPGLACALEDVFDRDLRSPM